MALALLKTSGQSLCRLSFGSSDAFFGQSYSISGMPFSEALIRRHLMSAFLITRVINFDLLVKMVSYRFQTYVFFPFVIPKCFVK